MRRPSFLFGCKIRPGKTRISFGEKQISDGFRLGTRGLSVLSGSAGKKSETSEHKPNFGNKTAGRGSANRGLVDRSHFSPHFRNLYKLDWVVCRLVLMNLARTLLFIVK